MENPVAPPASAPLPVPPPPRRPRWVAWLVAGIVVCSVAALVLVVVLLPRAFQGFVDSFDGPADYGPGGESVGWVLIEDARLEWTSDGDHALAQVADDRGVPRVVVWSRGTGETREAKGYVLAEVEQASPAAWLVARDKTAVLVETETVPPGDRDPDGPDDQYEQTYSSELPGPLETIDAPRGAVRWQLDRPGGPVEGSRSTTWAVWPAPRGGARALIDAADQNAFHAEPKAVVFEGGGKPPRAGNVPAADVFRPIGWSPSGRYFAAVGLRRTFEGGFTGSYEGENHLVVFSADDARIVSDVDLSGGGDEYEGDSYGEELDWRTAVWDGREDRLYLVKHHYSETTASEYSLLMTLAPGGGLKEAVPALGWRSPAAWAHAFEGRIIGSDDKGPIAAFGLDSEMDDDGNTTLHMYRLQASAPEYVGRVSVPGRVLAAAVSRRSDMLLLVEPEDAEEYRLEVHTGYSRESKTVWTYVAPEEGL